MTKNFNISDAQAPQMPTFTKSTSALSLLAQTITPAMREPVIPLMFSTLATFVKNVKFEYPDGTYKELCGQIAVLCGDSGCGKGQISYLNKELTKKLQEQDDAFFAQLNAWATKVKSQSSNSTKPERPTVYYRCPPANITNAALIQNCLALEEAGKLSAFISLPEIEGLEQLSGGKKQVTVLLRNIYDVERGGALRATVDGVTGNPVMRLNFSVSCTPTTARKFFTKQHLIDGTFGRCVLSFVPTLSRSGAFQKVKKISENAREKINMYITRLEQTEGEFTIAPLNKLIEEISEKMAEIGDLYDDNTIWGYAKRSMVNAWKAGCIMWILNERTWTKNMGEIVEWLIYRDLWSKLQLFGDMISEAEDDSIEKSRGPKNLLDELPDTFTIAQLVALRQRLKKNKGTAENQIAKWKTRGQIQEDEIAGSFRKTEKYLRNHPSKPVNEKS